MNSNQNRIPRLRHFSVVALLLCAVAAFGQTNMQLTGAGGNVFAGVYVNPYTASIGGVSTTVICNDFSADTWVGEEWTANVVELDGGNLRSTKQGQNWGGDDASLRDSYYAVAYLSVMLLAAPDQHTAALLSFAIWSVFDPSALSWLENNGVPSSSSDYQEIVNLRSSAFSAVSGGATPNFSASNVTIYSPIAGTATGCPGASCPANSPQEFIVVRTPEPSALSLLGFDLLALVGVVAVLFRGRKSMPFGLFAHPKGGN